MKVECINDKNQGDVPNGDQVAFGDIYEVVGTYVDGSDDMLLLAGMLRQNPHFGDGWNRIRFKELKRPQQISASKLKQRGILV